MKEYIERAAVLKVLEEYYSGVDERLHIVKDITSIPTADVAEVRHGYWDDSLDGITPYCSECRCTHRCLIRRPIYCPNCGALMMEDEHEAG